MPTKLGARLEQLKHSTSPAARTAAIALLLGMLLSPLWLEEKAPSEDNTATKPKLISEPISGRTAHAIAIALPIARRHGLDVGAYQVTALEFEADIAVIFVDASAEPGARGSGGPNMLPAFEVVVRSHDLRVIRANFSR